MADNTLYFCGNVTKEPEMRYTTTGTGLVKFGLAVNRKWKQGDEWKEEVTFVDCICWGQLAENVATSVSKGDRIMVSGRLDANNWEKDGVKHYGYQVTADEVCLSLKFATAKAERVSRQGTTRNADGFNQDPGGGDSSPF